METNWMSMKLSVDQILYKGYMHTQNYAAIPAKILSTPESVQSLYWLHESVYTNRGLSPRFPGPVRVLQHAVKYVLRYFHKLYQQNLHLLYIFALMLLLLVTVRHFVDGFVVVGALFIAHHNASIQWVTSALNVT
jgi:hypothetical protein